LEKHSVLEAKIRELEEAFQVASRNGDLICAQMYNAELIHTKVAAEAATVAEAVTVAATKVAVTVAATKVALQVATRATRTVEAHGPSAKRRLIGHVAETTGPTRSTAVQAIRRSMDPTASLVWAVSPDSAASPASAVVASASAVAPAASLASAAASQADASACNPRLMA